MKLNIAAILLAAHACHVLAATTSNPAAAEECGDLGIMEYDEVNLPQGMTPSDVRKCAKHPLGDTRIIVEGSLAPGGVPQENSIIIQPRRCSWDAPYGCAHSYCWKACGQLGEWCWMAEGDGTGPWVQCDTYKDYSILSRYGKGCGKNYGCGC
ncbi:uncharacterized protein F4807DRAFT_461757 [Annulohypoxylon truncatum]|uniref:uncharacterized protein n=1 Tax=Annulohypoxylon truncatum TaxID=327061 RepID=UPI002008B226|nr:uncharacterized protein F4807DRAFT_461757 [Annulohypoxylon truncatum]KAI1208430.1 hypothetical protein F4807DRAFT_461757 [Annulohypoxylon truncatum]